jgi:hypothetical protein
MTDSAVILENVLDKIAETEQVAKIMKWVRISQEYFHLAGPVAHAVEKLRKIIQTCPSSTKREYEKLFFEELNSTRFELAKVIFFTKIF